MTQLFDPAFRIIRMAANGTTELGFLRSVLDCGTRDILDQPGTLSFSIPASDEQAVEITAGSYFHAYDSQDGDLGLFVYQSSSVQERDGVATMRVECVSVMIELARTTTKFNRNFTNHDVAQVVNTLACIAAGWSTNCDAGMGFTAVDYQGESLLSGIDTLRERFKKHYRMQAGFDRRIEFGALGVDSGVRLVNKQASPVVVQNFDPNIVLVDSITRREDAESIINRIIPLGSGQGTAQVTLEASTYAGSYAVQTGLNPDGSNYYYIEDAASILAYGVHEQTIVYEDVRPITNSDAGKENAANEIHKSAEAELLEFKDPHVTYDVSTINLPGTVQVGDKVRLRYRGSTDGNTYLDVNELVFLTEINRQRRAEGGRTQRLTLGSNAEAAMTDAKLVASSVKKAQVLVTHPQAYPYFNLIPWVRFIGRTALRNDNVNLKFTVDNKVTSITSITLAFNTTFLYTWLSQTRAVSDQVFWRPEMWAGEGGNIGVRDVHLYIDLVDVTAALGGPWSTNNVTQIDEEVDITDYIVNSPSGLYADHYIYFESQTTLAGWTQLAGEAARAGDTNYSQLEVIVRILGTTQAILSA